MELETLVIGQGMAGFSAAMTLKNRNHHVGVLSLGPGATMLSSGSWDIGSLKDESITTLESAWKSREWQSALKKPFCEIENQTDAQEAIEAGLKEIAQAIAPNLKMKLSFSKAMLLPTTAGTWKRTFVAQDIQAAADFETLRNRRTGVLHSDQWRYPSAYLHEFWSRKFQKPSETIVRVTLPIMEKLSDASPIRLATQLHADGPFAIQFWESVKKAVRGMSLDYLIIPPLFLDANLVSRRSDEIGVRVVEPLCTTEPVAGERLRHAMTEATSRMRLQTLASDHIVPEISENEIKSIRVGDSTVTAKHYILATGKYLGSGIQLGYDQIAEPIFRLPLFWNREFRPLRYRREIPFGEADFHQPQLWSQIGLRLDRQWRPVDETKSPALKNLRACGSLIGGVDYASHGIGLGWMALTGRLCGFSHLEV